MDHPQLPHLHELLAGLQLLAPEQKQEVLLCGQYMRQLQERQRVRSRGKASTTLDTLLGSFTAETQETSGGTTFPFPLLGSWRTTELLWTVLRPGHHPSAGDYAHPPSASQLLSGTGHGHRCTLQRRGRVRVCNAGERQSNGMHCWGQAGRGHTLQGRGRRVMWGKEASVCTAEKRLGEGVHCREEVECAGAG